MAEFKLAAKLSELKENGVVSVQIGYDHIMLCRTGDSIFALADECSHDSAPISDGHLLGHEIVCPRHGARFDIKSGEATGPPAVAPIDRYEVKIEGDDIFVLL